MRFIIKVAWNHDKVMPQLPLEYVKNRPLFSCITGKSNVPVSIIKDNEDAFLLKKIATHDFDLAF